MTDNHAGRALRPLSVNVPLKVGTDFEVKTEENTIYVSVIRTFDFEVTLSVENYGTLTKLIDALTSAQEAELERIKTESAAARNERSRSYKPIRDEQQKRRTAGKKRSARERSRRAK